MLQDNGSTYDSAPATHNLTLYRANSGAMVFGAGTVQWPWGLDSHHDRGNAAPSLVMQQATVNLFADMGAAQPQTLQTGLTFTPGSVDSVPPTSVITTPANGTQVPANTTITVSGTAQDVGGGIVAGVEVSLDGGLTWHRASGRSAWSYTWATGAPRTVNIRSRATDDSGNVETSNTGVSVTVSSTAPPNCPCSIWTPSAIPANPAEPDAAAVELGVKFTTDVSGVISGIRFYKSTQNTGTHIGNLWTNTGSLLGTAVFTSETGSGWQQVNFSTPITVFANVVYIASYHTNSGNYAADNSYFLNHSEVNGPLHALADGTNGGNGVYHYGSSAFPTSASEATNYWVDVVFNLTTGPDTTPPVVLSQAPSPGSANVSATGVVSATFNEPLQAASVSTNTFELRNASNTLVGGTVSYDGAAFRVTFTPSAALAYSSTYTATLKGGPTDPRIKDVAGNALSANVSWSFTTSATPPPPPDTGPGGPILVVSSTSNPFSKYYAEILRTEGLNAFAVADISAVTASTLANYDVVLLGDFTLTSTQVSMFTTWVNGGGNLIAMHPASNLASLLGLNSGSTLDKGYLLVNTAAAPQGGSSARPSSTTAGQPLLIERRGRGCDALFERRLGDHEPCGDGPSVGSNGGQAAAFAFDLARPSSTRVRETRRGSARNGTAWRPSGRTTCSSVPARRSSAGLGRSEQGGDPASRRAAASAGKCDRVHQRGSQTVAAILVFPERQEGRGRDDRRRPREQRHSWQLRYLQRQSRWLQCSELGMHLWHFLHLSDYTDL